MCSSDLKHEMNARLQSSELQGTKKPPKGASAKESSCKKASKQQKTNCAAEDDANLKDKGKGKAVDKASKVRQQGMFFLDYSSYLSCNLLRSSLRQDPCRSCRPFHFTSHSHHHISRQVTASYTLHHRSLGARYRPDDHH